MMRPSTLAIAGLIMIFSSSVWAQPVPSREPSSTHIFPAGGRRGTSVSVLVGAECIPPQTSFRIWGAGVTAPAELGPRAHARLEPSPRREPRELPISYPKEWQSHIDIAADAAPGVRMWRLTCARGGTGTRPFVIGDLPEMIETESNSTAERAERVELPVTINGRIAGENDLDYYIFSAQQGDVVLCDVVAGRLGSPLDPLIEIYDASQQRIPTEILRLGTDPIVAFRAPSSGDFRLLVSNISFHGSPAHVYRVTLKTVEPPTDNLSTMLPSLLALGGVPSTVSALDHFSRAPGSSDPNRLVADAPFATVAEPMLLTPPAVVRGRLESAHSEDWFRFSAAKEQFFVIDCRAWPAGLPTLPVVTITDAQGRVLREVKSVENAEKASVLEWQSPHDGEYRLRVRDAQHGIRGGDEFVYALTLRPIGPDFSLRLDTDFANIVQGGRAELQVVAQRVGGFAARLDVSIVGLPPGLHADPTQIAAGQNTAKVAIIADGEARPTDATVRVVGRASAGADMIERTATAPHLGIDAEGVSIAATRTEDLQLTVQHKPVFRLYCSEAYQYAHRGTIYPYAMQIERLDGFDGPITVQLGDRQNRDLDGVQFLEVTAQPGQMDVKVPIFFPESMHINVLSQSQIYAQAYAIFTDRWGQQQSTLVVSEKRNMVRTLPTVVKLQAVDQEISASPGSVVRCRFSLDRTSNFPGAMDIELVEPDSPQGFKADKVRIETARNSAEMTIRIPPEIRGTHPPLLRFRARGQLAPEVAVVSEATVALKWE